MIHLSVEEPPWDPSTSEYSEREIQMVDHQGQISITATASRRPVFISTVVSYSLAYDAVDVMDNENLAIALEAQIQISIALIGMVIKLSIDALILAIKYMKIFTLAILFNFHHAPSGQRSLRLW